MKPTKILFTGMIMFIILLTQTLALSDPINQSLSEFTNMTKADNVVELAVEINTWVGGAFGIMILVAVFGVTFAMTMFFTQHIARSMTLSMFIVLISSILLKIVGLVPDLAIYYSVPIFLLSVAFAIITR